MVIANCETCNREFQTKNALLKIGKGKYCSRQCSDIGRRKWVELICLVCKKKFTTRECYYIRDNPQCCSRECMGVARRGGVKKDTSKKTVLSCSFCRKQYEIKLGTRGKNNIRYCSEQCAKSSSDLQTERICQYCGKEFSIYVSRIIKNGGIYCSQGCSNLGRKGQPIGGSPIERFIRSIIILPGLNSCWLWTASSNNKGYGFIYVDGNEVLTHRFSYEYFRGPLGNSLALHTCDIPACCAPHHLYKGDYVANGIDAVTRGRSTAILTIEQVKEVLLNPQIPALSFAKKFKVSESAIYLIRSRKNWKHVKID